LNKRPPSLDRLPDKPGRSHPPALRRLVERAVLEEELFVRGDLVLVACSGGPDSTALLHVLAMLRRSLGHRLAAHGVDHGLRAEAARELSLVAEVCQKIEVPFEVTRVEVAPGGNLQARAREARHRALQDAAAHLGAAVIATGHTADDKAETVLMRLLRGAGPRGLAVLAPRGPAGVGPSEDLPGARARDLVRPLIHARRSDVLAHLGRHELPFAEDPSNADDRFLRVRVRREVLPLLGSLSPGIIEHLCALADMLGEACLPDEELGGLGRAQRRAARRAQRSGAPNVKIRVKGGRDVLVTFPGGKIVLNEKK